MPEDILAFWRDIAPEARTHPADHAILGQLEHHGFDLRCLPLPFFGPLRTAPVVLLFHSPGLAHSDVELAETAAAQDFHVRMRAGNTPLPSRDEYPRAAVWTEKLLRQFDLRYGAVRDKVAVLDVSAYHSEIVRKPPLFVAIPSSRISVGWAQNVLFPQALRGERAVLCLRARGSWGLGRMEQPDGGLFAPEVTQGGFLPVAGRAVASRSLHLALKR